MALNSEFLSEFAERRIKLNSRCTNEGINWLNAGSTFWTCNADAARDIFEISNKSENRVTDKLSRLSDPKHKMDNLLWCLATQSDVLTRGQPSFDGSGNKWRCFPLKLIPSSQINTFIRGRIIPSFSSTCWLVSSHWNNRTDSFRRGDTISIFLLGSHTQLGFLLELGDIFPETSIPTVRTKIFCVG